MSNDTTKRNVRTNEQIIADLELEIQRRKEAAENGQGRPGRQAAFPGEETAKRVYRLPLTTIQLIEQVAGDNEETLAEALHRMVQAYEA